MIYNKPSKMRMSDTAQLEDIMKWSDALYTAL